MKKILTTLVVAIILIVGIWLVLVKPAQTPSTVVPSAPTVSGQTTITMKSFAFSPAQVTINKGATVVWTNEDSAPHQLKSDSGFVAMDSQIIPQDSSFSVVFNQAGTYAYHCTLHPSMIGTIIVQ